MDTKVTDALIGALVDGRYRVRARVARGGMATVYTATDERLERIVALKIIHPAHANNAHFLDRFAEEAKTIARLAHPHVVGVYDQGSHAGLPYLVMEYVRGHTLREVLAQRGRLSPLEALTIMEQILAAVAAAHRAGLVHRDIKPENVLVAMPPHQNSLVDAVVKVADFGLAQAVEASTEEVSGGSLMATVAYVAPELISTGATDPRGDVYSAGIVLFEMLTGRVPYEGDKPMEVAWQHVDREVPPPSAYAPGVPPLVDDLVARATRRDPGGRPTDAGALLAEVQAVREDVGMATSRYPSLANTATTTVNQVPVIDTPTMVTQQRPSWARLPSGRQASVPRGRRAAPAPAPARAPAPPPVSLAWARLVSRPAGRRGVMAAATVLVLLFGTGIWWLAAGRYTSTPNLIGKPRAAAVALARQDGFTVRFAAGQFDDGVPKDSVLLQSPIPSARIVKGSAITLILSKGPEQYKVPDIVGRAWDVAQAELQAIKATPERSDQYSDTIPSGSVIKTTPAAGTVVPPGAQISVIISKGKAPLTMPNVIGQDVNAATAALEQMGLKVAMVTQASNQPANQVINQDPPQGAGVDTGWQVTLTVSQGPPQVAVPNVVGQTVATATQMLQAAGFTVTVNGNSDPNAHMVAQFPNGNQPQGTQITIVAF